MKRFEIFAVVLLAIGLTIAATQAHADWHDHDRGGFGLRINLFSGSGWHRTYWENQGAEPGNFPGFHFRASVDDTVDVAFQGDQVWTRVLHGKGVEDVHARIGTPLPYAPVNVRLHDVYGRGNVTVLQQPRPWNRFTAIVRIDDPQDGRGDYSFGLNF